MGDSAYYIYSNDNKHNRPPSIIHYFFHLNRDSPVPMDKMERFFKIDQMLRTARYGVTRQQFLDELEVSPATFKRDLEYLRDRMHAPIDYDKKLKGYVYIEDSDFQLPGLWMNEGEIHALLTMQHLLTNLQPGMLDDHIKPLMERITNLLELGEHTEDEINKRIRILSMANRAIDHGYFELLTSAVLQRQRINITYYNRADDIETIREVSPQRLIHYRDNWYLDTWCHLRDGLRTFAVESIKKAELLPDKAKNVSEKLLNEELGSGYGIFTGSKTHQVTLRFNPLTARWVSSEQWHPGQHGGYDEEGYYVLSFPFSDDRELIQDILKYGPNVEVIKPASLKKRVKQALQEAVQQYQ